MNLCGLTSGVSANGIQFIIHAAENHGVPSVVFCGILAIKVTLLQSVIMSSRTRIRDPVSLILPASRWRVLVAPPTIYGKKCIEILYFLFAFVLRYSSIKTSISPSITEIVFVTSNPVLLSLTRRYG